VYTRHSQVSLCQTKCFQKWIINFNSWYITCLLRHAVLTPFYGTNKATSPRDQARADIFFTFFCWLYKVQKVKRLFCFCLCMIYFLFVDQTIVRWSIVLKVFYNVWLSNILLLLTNNHIVWLSISLLEIG